MSYMGPNTNILYNSVVTLVSGHTLFQVTAKRLNLFQPSLPVLFYHVDVSVGHSTGNM